jgi:hypothetical protein
MTVILTLTMAISTILRNVLSGKGLEVEGFEDAKKEPEEEHERPNEKTVPEPFYNKEEDSDPGSSVSGKNLVVNKKTTPTQKQLMDNLKENALDLHAAQKEILSGFEKIEPYMNKAESLIGNIQQTALTIQEMRNKQVNSNAN